MRTGIIILFSLLVATVSHAQQTPVTNFPHQNLYAINPGYAGHNGCLEAFGNYRMQWLGFPGAPRTYGLQVHTSIKEKMGAGGSFSMDKLGNQSLLKASGSFAYMVKLNAVNKLRFGLAAGIIQHTMTTAGAIVEDQGDPLASAAFAGLSYGGHAGVVFSNDKLIAGLVLPQLYYTATPGGGSGYRWKQHIEAHGSYLIEGGGKLATTPAILIRAVPASVLQVDISLQGVYNELMMFGLSYRNGAGFSVMVGLKNYKNFTLGYAYEIPLLGTQQYSTGSHEILLGYKLCRTPGGQADPRKDRARDNY